MDTYRLLELSGQGDRAARDKLVMENTPLVYSVVRRFSTWGYDLNDLFQIGVIGLIKAIDKFDPSFNVKFSTYAVPMISGEVKRFLRDDGIIRISRNIKDNIRAIAKVTDEYIKEKAQEPDIDYISVATGISKEDILIAMEAKRPVESMDSNVTSDDGSGRVLENLIADKSDFEKNVINDITVKSLLKELPLVERQLIELRYFMNMTQTQVAQRLNMNQVQVSRMEKKILLKLRSYI